MKYLKTYDDWKFTEVSPFTLKLNNTDDMSIDRKKSTVERFSKSMKILTLDETVDYVIEHCKDFIDNPILVGRGINETKTKTKKLNDFGEVDYFYSKPVKRFSRDDKNYYNLIIDNSIKWKNYPKRNKSFMCSLNKAETGLFHYFVIPEDDSRWGIAPTSDIYSSFNDSIRKYTYTSNISNINILFRQIDILSNDYDIKLSDTNYNEFRNGIKKLQSKIINDEQSKNSVVTNDSGLIQTNGTLNRQCKTAYRLKSFLNIYGDNIFRTILKILDPIKNDFKNLTWKEIYSEILNNNLSTVNREMWTESPCVFVNGMNWSMFINKLEEKTGKEIKFDIHQH